MAIPDRAMLERNKLFRDIHIESIENALQGCQTITLNSGSTLLDAGQKNASLFLVLEGEMRVYLNAQDLSAHAVLGPGECVGELSLIDGGKTSALVMAARDSRLLVLPHELVWSMVDSSHAIARNLLSILAGRIRNDNLLQVTTSESCLEFELATNIDPLTGLHNKNWLDEAFHRMAQRHERDGTPLFMLVVDIDRFKELKESHGHLAGDAVLKGVAHILAANLRPQDVLACLGGDRFAVMLPEKSVDGAQKRAERLREAVASPVLRFGKGTVPKPVNSDHAIHEEHVTVSLGISEVRHNDSLEAVLADADGAVKQAKQGGRNQVRMAAARS